MYVVLRHVEYEQSDGFLGMWASQEEAIKWAEAELKDSEYIDYTLTLHLVEPGGPWVADEPIRIWTGPAPASAEAWSAEGDVSQDGHGRRPAPISVAIDTEWGDVDMSAADDTDPSGTVEVIDNGWGCALLPETVGPTYTRNEDGTTSANHGPE